MSPDQKALNEEIERLINEYGNDVLRTAYLYLKKKSLAEDAFQEVFIKVYENYDSYRGDSSEKTWIIRITINVCKDLLKSTWFKKVLTFNEKEEHFLNLIEQDHNTQVDNDLLEFVLTLPEKYREVIILYYYQGFDTNEIASILKTKPTTVRSRLKRAKEKLKIDLTREGSFNG
ncbi:sigma-70 family RNA polymerase sigma factor [Haloplasma contractile]|uniref:RNA polymerase sigma factor protein n=1 Tax=Haloplasma contractile SSD-17B TaxID=1033810 RepID=U2DYK1_9MOLU|nr:sigma-70 family RNA polymerase sigma factor [Haloplasma contractile]ERJ13332.1 RNA polymerase sigma factor protein [Haloplasma contractile SSD-17B]